MTVGNIIGGLLAHGFFKKNDERMQEYIIKTMEDAGLASYFPHRFPHQFSGGQRQRIGIARSFGGEAEVRRLRRRRFPRWTCPSRARSSTFWLI